MSFIRTGRSHSATNFGRKKKPVKKKPVWDVSQNLYIVNKMQVATVDHVLLGFNYGDVGREVIKLDNRSRY